MAFNFKQIGLPALILVIAAAILVFYGFTTYRPKPYPVINKSSNSSVQSPNNKDLRAAAKELSGDVGIVGELTGGTNKGSVIAMVVFSIIGLGYMTYGKKSQQLIMVICGIGLMGYSYFVDGTLFIILIGLVLSALPFVLGRK
ncbi:MAG: hypothetical protein WBM69_29410 [Desulfobacterales bacterium]